MCQFPLREEERKEFFEASKPLMKWLGENCHPHTQALIDCATAQLVEGVCQEVTEEFLPD